MNEIQNPVGLELDGVASQILLVKFPKLCLALVILTQVAFLQCYPGMNLVDLCGKFVLDVLNSQVLSQGLELVTSISVIGILSPFLLEVIQSFAKKFKWPYIVRIGR